MIPRVAILVNGASDSIEAVRASGLSQNHARDSLLILHRSASKSDTAAAWHRELEAFKPQVIYVMNTAMPGIQVAWQWRRAQGVPFILDTGDAVLDMARSAGTAPWWRLPALWAGERLAQSRAAHIVVRGTRHKEHLEQNGHREVTVIRDGYVDRGDISTASVEALRSKLGLEGSFVVGLIGSLVFSQKLKICYGWDLVEALTELRDLPVKGLIIGDGPGRPWLEAKAVAEGVRNQLIFTGRVDYPEVPLHLHLMDVALSTQTNNLAGQARTTGKLPEYMAAGRFILASRVGEAALVLPDGMLLDYHGTVDSGYPTRLAARVRELVGDRSALNLRSELPERARVLFSYGVLSTLFDATVRRIVKGA